MFKNISPKSFMFKNLNFQKFPAVRYICMCTCLYFFGEYMLHLFSASGDDQASTGVPP